jgi:4-hydroxy-4-methyl-2-oxoglutarate aldolase
VIVADDDGAVCVPRADTADVIESCERRVVKEAAAREAYSRGELSLDVNGLRGLVSDLAVEYRTWHDEQL